MSVYVVAILAQKLPIVSGSRVPDGAGAYVGAFDSESDARSWILEPVRPRFSTDEGECPMVVTDLEGVIV